MLDPWISYDGLAEDFKESPELLKDLKALKSKLEAYFNRHYKKTVLIPLSAASSAQSVTSEGSKSSEVRVDFMARYRRKERTTINELAKYWKLPQEDMDSCNPINWWYTRRFQFPNLYCLARDLLGIPGMFACSPAFTLIDLTGRLCRCCRVHILGWEGHHISSACES